MLCRPPYSLGIFTLVQAQAITQWFLTSYYMHYKLYQYAFTHRCALCFSLLSKYVCHKSVMSGVAHCRISCNVSSAHPGDIVELPPQLTPLQEADTEEQHQFTVEAQQKQVSSHLLRLTFNASLSCFSWLQLTSKSYAKGISN